MDKIDFLDCLLECPRGQIVLCNMLDGLDEELFAQDFVRDVFNWWHDYFLFRFPNTGDCNTENELLATLDLLLFELTPPNYQHVTTRPDFHFACGYATHDEDDNGYLHVTDVHGFIFHLMASEARDRNLDDITISPEPTDKEVAGFNLKKPRKIRLKEKNADGSPMTLGRKGRGLWFTSADQLPGNGKVTLSADNVRDYLGLVHYVKDTALMTIRLPAYILKTAKTGRPTFADAGGHTRFKARADLPKHQKNKAWGYAADLDSFATSGKTIDGWPERIAAPLPTSHFPKRAVETLPLQTLAHTRGLKDKPPNRDDHQAFAERLLARHTDLNNLRNRILVIIT